MAQINGAVEEMNAVTQRSASSSEESASAAEELASQAQRMSALVDRFRLSGGQGEGAGGGRPAEYRAGHSGHRSRIAADRGERAERAVTIG